jgi:hypothetical protein
MGGMMNEGPRPGGGGPVTSAQLRVAAGDRAGRPAIPTTAGLRDLREAEIDRRRTITFQMSMGAMIVAEAAR